MDRRLFTAGAVTVIAGLAGFVVLLLDGVIRHPAAAATAYGPETIAAIGGSFLLVTIGVVVVFRSLMLATEAGSGSDDGTDEVE